MNICSTFLSASSTASPRSVSRSELDLGEIAVTGAGVCTPTGPGHGGLMEGVCNSSLTFLPLSSHTFIMVGSGSFASNFQFPDYLDGVLLICQIVLLLPKGYLLLGS